MRLGIDLRALQCAHRGRGIGRYTANLLSYISNEVQDELFLFYLEGQPGINGKTDFPTFHPSPISLHRGLQSTSVKIATHINMPWRMWRAGLDVMLFPQGPGAEAACAIPRMVPCPFIVVVHDLIPLLFPGYYPQFINSALYKEQCQLLSRAKALIADSNCTKNNIASNLNIKKENIRVIYPGVDPIFSPVNNIDELSRVWTEFEISTPYFLSVGGYDWRKNLSSTLRAFALMQEESGSDQWLVVVDNRANCPEETLALIEELDISHRVNFTGIVSDETLRALYGGAQALLFPSFYEGFGLPALESMACGTPVICSNIEALQEVAAETALYVEPEDVEDLAAQMLRVSQEPELCRELSALGIAQAERFSWRTTAVETLAFCSHIAEIPESAKV